MRTKEEVDLLGQKLVTRLAAATVPLPAPFHLNQTGRNLYCVAIVFAKQKVHLEKHLPVDDSHSSVHLTGRLLARHQQALA